MIEATFSPAMKAQLKRIQNLPRLYNDVVHASVKRDALGVITEFRMGIKKNSLGLDPLSMRTIDKKRAEGLKKPIYPLYGVGPDDVDSYMNMMVVKKIDNGYEVTPSEEWHHTEKIKLDHLFQIHEYGATIKLGRGRNTRYIKIPPRPALFLGYQKYMNKRKRMEPKPAVEVKRAINQYVKEGKTDLAKKIKRSNIRGRNRGLREL